MTEHRIDKSSGDNVPLCVDVDGTLIRSDLLLESILALLKQNLLNCFRLPFWLFKGKAHFKQQIANRVDLEVELLPYNESFLNYLKEQKTLGRELILATASNSKYAEQIALHLDIFDQVMASDANTNLDGYRKQQRLLDAFGEKGFDYAANAMIDLKVWKHARKALLVEPDSGVKEKAEKLVLIDQVFDRQQFLFRTYLKSLRMHQWTKNFLIFIPLIMAHRVGDPNLFLQATLAFLAFGLCSSSAYLLNDLLDLSADRHHPSKRNRPLAAGKLPIEYGILSVPLLLLAALFLASFLPTPFSSLLAAYYLITLTYSLKLKQLLIVDVLTLAGLYTMRLVTGGAAVGITLSFWLLAFSTFLFLSLALVKRYSELLVVRPKENEKIRGRSYQQNDMEGLAQFGSASGFISVLVLAFYINSEEVSKLYSQPKLIWILCPLLLYWISRVWLLTRRDQMHEDPIVFAMKDRTSYVVGIIGLLTLWIAA
jgi:4-hydroxybenzoate polyprenyltransferase